jgi:hypothetical protein
MAHSHTQSRSVKINRDTCMHSAPQQSDQAKHMDYKKISPQFVVIHKHVRGAYHSREQSSVLKKSENTPLVRVQMHTQ